MPANTATTDRAVTKPRRPYRVARTPLTEAQQAIVAEAWKYALAVIRKHQKKLHGPDYDGAVAERLVTMAPSYDPTKSSIPTWANNQAKFACWDAMRVNPFWGKTHRRTIKTKAPKVKKFGWSSDGLGSWHPKVHDPQCELEQDDAIRELVGGMTNREFRIVIAYHRNGLSMREIGVELGVSESRISLMLTAILARIADRIERGETCYD